MAASKRWRLYVTQTQSTAYVTLAELALRTAVGGANIASTGTASASSTYGASYLAQYAFDGSVNTSWASASGLPQWVECNFPSEVTIAQFSITASNTVPAEAPKSFVLQYWDGAAWVDGYSVIAAANWTSSETRTYATNLLTAPPSRPQVFVCT